jgi:hypothetical protein
VESGSVEQTSAPVARAEGINSQMSLRRQTSDRCCVIGGGFEQCNCDSFESWTRFSCSSDPGIFKEGRESSAAAVRERVCFALAIVRDESPDGHRLHRMSGNADRAAISGSRDEKQDYTIVCAERSSQF